MLITDKYNYDVAIQLIVKGSEFEGFIEFRDALIADFRLVEEYNNIKALYSNCSDEEYRLNKSRFILKALKEKATC